MKKLTLILTLLVAMVTTAMAQINYGKGLWTFPATGHEAVTEVPAEIFEDFKQNYKVENTNEETGEVTTTYTELTNEKVGVYVTRVRVAAEGNVTATFVYNGGNIRMDIAGVDLLNADGEVVYSDYHFGYAGGNLQDNVYTLQGVAVGDYTMRLFIPAQKEDITSSANDSKGTITLVGAWMYPNENVFYNIKNVRSNKYATFKGEGKRFTQENASNGAGSYWYFVEASLDDVKAKNNAWLENDAIPAGYKAYWIYNAACELPVENVTNGYMSAVDASPYPAKIYYVGVHTKDDVTGLVIRPCHEDASSWNDDGGNGTQLGHYYSNDTGSLWSVEVANVGESDLIAIGTAAKNEALATVAAYEQAYYDNHTVAQIDAAKTAINNIDCSTVVKALTSVIDGSANAVLTELANSSKVTPKAGDRFMIKNRGRSGNNYLRAYAAGTDVKCSDFANDLNALDLIWTLVASDTDGFFKLYSERLGVYVGTLSTSNNAKMQYTSDIAAAGLYEISQDGAYTLFHAKDQDASGYMHQSGWGGKEIVRWDNGDCSQWLLIAAPFELTTDIENPICYAIKSGRDGNYYFTLENNKIKLINNQDIVGNNNAKWFFMLDENKNLKIYPYADKENTMGYITVADGNTKLTNNHSAGGFVADTYNLYYNTNNAADNNGKCFAFRPTEGNTFVSNHGGTGNYMGFYNEHNDKGTRIGFENINKVVLKNKIDAWEQYFDHEGDKVCQYIIADEIKTAVNEATNVIATKPSCNADFDTEVKKFKDLTFPEINKPATGKYYRLKNGASGWYATSDLRTGENEHSNKLHMKEDGTQANTIWYVDEDNALLSYTKGQYLGDMSSDWSFEAISSTGNATTFAQGATIGKIQIQPSSGRALYGDKIRVDAAGDGSKSGNYEWTIEEVETLPVTITAAGYASFYTPVAVTVPSGIEAHYLTKIIGEFASMTKIESGIIPANTGVILTGENGEPATEGTYYFEITDDVSPFEGNMFKGTVATEYVTGDAYVLAIKDNNVGLYSVTLNKEDGTAFQNNSHKAYLPAGTSTMQNSAGFRFSFGGTTAVEDVEIENEREEIYDLTGRKLSEITKPGIYIINGKKVLVK